jgi:hypothetical protein
LTEGQKSENMAFQERLYREYTLFPNSVPSPVIAAAREYCPFYGCNQTLASELRYRVHSVLCEFIANLNIVVSFYHTMAMKCCLEHGEIERQWKCKICM